MSLAYTVWAFQQDGLTGTEKFVLVALADRVNEDGECWPSIERVARDTSFGERTVKRAIARLVALGLIERSRGRRSNGYLGGNVYLFPPIERLSQGPNQGPHRHLDPGATQARQEPITSTSESDHPTGGTASQKETVQTLVAHYCDQLDSQPPARARARVGREVKLLVGEGFGLTVIQGALDRMAERRLDPSLLPTLVAEQLDRRSEETDGFLHYLGRSDGD